jgi:hypothetical protein
MPYPTCLNSTFFKIISSHSSLKTSSHLDLFALFKAEFTQLKTYLQNNKNPVIDQVNHPINVALMSLGFYELNGTTLLGNPTYTLKFPPDEEPTYEQLNTYVTALLALITFNPQLAAHTSFEQTAGNHITHLAISAANILYKQALNDPAQMEELAYRVSSFPPSSPDESSFISSLRQEFEKIAEKISLSRRVQQKWYLSNQDMLVGTIDETAAVIARQPNFMQRLADQVYFELSDGKPLNPHGPAIAILSQLDCIRPLIRALSKIISDTPDVSDRLFKELQFRHPTLSPLFGCVNTLVLSAPGSVTHIELVSTFLECLLAKSNTSTPLIRNVITQHKDHIQPWFSTAKPLELKSPSENPQDTMAPFLPFIYENDALGVLKLVQDPKIILSEIVLHRAADLPVFYGLLKEARGKVNHPNFSSVRHIGRLKEHTHGSSLYLLLVKLYNALITYSEDNPSFKDFLKTSLGVDYNNGTCRFAPLSVLSIFRIMVYHTQLERYLNSPDVLKDMLHSCKNYVLWLKGSRTPLSEATISIGAPLLNIMEEASSLLLSHYSTLPHSTKLERLTELERLYDWGLKENEPIENEQLKTAVMKASPIKARVGLEKINSGDSTRKPGKTINRHQS